MDLQQAYDMINKSFVTSINLVLVVGFCLESYIYICMMTVQTMICENKKWKLNDLLLIVDGGRDVIFPYLIYFFFCVCVYVCEWNDKRIKYWVDSGVGQTDKENGRERVQCNVGCTYMIWILYGESEESLKDWQSSFPDCVKGEIWK